MSVDYLHCINEKRQVVLGEGQVPPCSLVAMLVAMSNVPTMEKRRVNVEPAVSNIKDEHGSVPTIIIN